MCIRDRCKWVSLLADKLASKAGRPAAMEVRVELANMHLFIIQQGGDKKSQDVFPAKLLSLKKMQKSWDIKVQGLEVPKSCFWPLLMSKKYLSQSHKFKPRNQISSKHRCVQKLLTFRNINSDTVISHFLNCSMIERKSRSKKVWSGSKHQHVQKFFFSWWFIALERDLAAESHINSSLDNYKRKKL